MTRRPGDESLLSVANLSPVVQYGNLLMLSMIKDQLFELKIDSMGGMSSYGEADLDRPPYEMLANRIKILLNLDPVSCREEISGVIPLSMAGYIYTLVTTFQDTSELSWFMIEILKYTPRDEWPDADGRQRMREMREP